MKKPWDQINPIAKFFIQIWLCILLVYIVVYTIIKSTYARMIGKKYYWKSDTIK